MNIYVESPDSDVPCVSWTLFCSPEPKAQGILQNGSPPIVCCPFSVINTSELSYLSSLKENLNQILSRASLRWMNDYTSILGNSPQSFGCMTTGYQKLVTIIAPLFFALIYIVAITKIFNMLENRPGTTFLLYLRPHFVCLQKSS